jgi:hypothetical protein
MFKTITPHLHKWVFPIDRRQNKRCYVCGYKSKRRGDRIDDY